LHAAVDVGGHDGILRRIDNRAVARVPAFAQQPLALDRGGDVIDLNQAVPFDPGAEGTDDQIVQQRPAVRHMEGKKLGMQRMGQHAGGAGFQRVFDRTEETGVVQGRERVPDRPAEQGRSRDIGGALHPVVPGADAVRLVEDDDAGIERVQDIAVAVRCIGLGRHEGFSNPLI
jgi:hypothetical protein